jgi:hypothetical protein
VVAGVVTDPASLYKVHREHREILRILDKHGIRPCEMRAADAYRGRNRWEGVPPAERQLVFDLLLDWAVQRKCRVIVSPVDTGRFFDRKVNGCTYANWFGFPYEAAAFNLLLAIQRHHAATTKKNRGRTFVVFDERRGHDEQLIRLLSKDLSITDDFTGYSPTRKSTAGRFDQIIDMPQFSKAHSSIPIQIADCIAFVVRSYLLIFAFGREDRYPGEFVVIEKWYKRIGKLLWPAGCIDPPGKNGLSACYRELRPSGWSAQKWMVQSF